MEKVKLSSNEDFQNWHTEQVKNMVFGVCLVRVKHKYLLNILVLF